MNMKKYTQAPVQGFTLVELIVVIVILAILATIAFLSFGSQSASARDAKRKQDLSNMSTKMNVALANGTTVLGLVADSLASVSWAKIGWTWAISWWTWDYMAWWINFNILWVAAWDFADPLGSAYKIGATSNVGWVFQLAATLENDSAGSTTKNALVIGTYSARTQLVSSGIVSSISTWSSTASIWLPSSLIGMYKKSDWILVSSWATNTVTGQITNVSADYATLSVTFSWGVNYTWATANAVVKLTTDEVAWLVKDSSINTWAVSNQNTTFLPYR